MKEEDIKTLNFKNIILSGIFTAGSLIIGFVWKDYMDKFVAQFSFGTGIIYAIGMTVIVTIVMFLAYKLSDTFDQKYKENKEYFIKKLKEEKSKINNS